MTKSLFRALFAVTGAALLAVTALPAAGATITYNDPNCAGFQITGSGGSFVLTCAKLHVLDQRPDHADHGPGHRR